MKYNNMRISAITENTLLKGLVYGLAIAIISVLFFSLIPRFNGFPTGIDAPHHITWARSFVEHTYPPAFLWGGSNPSPYPLPEIVFALLYEITGVGYEVIFSYLVIAFVLSDILIVALLAYRLFGYYESLFVLVVGVALPFLSEHISIGTLAEAYGTFILFLILYSVVIRKYWLTAALALVGFFSHPFVVLLLGVSAAALVPFVLVRRKTITFIKQHRRVVYGVVAATVSFAVLIVSFFDKIKGVRAVNALLSDDFIIRGGKAYLLEEIVQRNDIIPYVYLLALLGIALTLRNKRENEMPFFLPLLPVFGALVFNHLFFINIEPYRFIAYVELFALLYASYAVIFLFRKIRSLLPRNVIATTVVFFAILTVAVFAVISNVSTVGGTIDYYTTPRSLGKLPQDDLAVMQWIQRQENFDNSASICTLYKWGYWIPPIAQKQVLFAGYEEVDASNNVGCRALFNSDDASVIIAEAQASRLRYVYFSSHQTISKTVLKNFVLLYQSGNAAIFQIY